jgi:hypothetical protein
VRDNCKIHGASKKFIGDAKLAALLGKPEFTGKEVNRRGKMITELIITTVDVFRSSRP